MPVNSEKIILSSAVQQISNTEKQKPYTLVKAKGWHKGVIGIIASRLKENSLFELVCVVEPNSDVHSDIKEMGLKPILDFNEAVKI